MSNQFEYKDVKEVREVHRDNEANALLRKGWILLAVQQSGGFYGDGTGSMEIVYVLGTDRKLGNDES